MSNTNLLLVMGESGEGKTASLRNLPNPEGVWYLNFEAGKHISFNAKFEQFNITDPYDAHAALQEAEKDDTVHTVVFDSITFMMDLFETVVIKNSADSRKAWGDYSHYWKELMVLVAKSTKNVIMLAHTKSDINDYGVQVKSVPVKGALAGNGLEAYFSSAVAVKKMRIKDLEGYKNPLLNITEEEEILGFKHVYQTKVTKQTVGEKIRGPMGMWSKEETFIDNDVSLVLQRLKDYYA